MNIINITNNGRITSIHCEEPSNPFHFEKNKELNIDYPESKIENILSHIKTIKKITKPLEKIKLQESCSK